MWTILKVKTPVILVSSLFLLGTASFSAENDKLEEVKEKLQNTQNILVKSIQENVKELDLGLINKIDDVVESSKMFDKTKSWTKIEQLKDTISYVDQKINDNKTLLLVATGSYLIGQFMSQDYLLGLGSIVVGAGIGGAYDYLTSEKKVEFSQGALKRYMTKNSMLSWGLGTLMATTISSVGWSVIKG